MLIKFSNTGKILKSCIFCSIGVGPCIVVLRAYAWVYVQGSLFMVVTGPDRVPGIKLRLDSFKASDYILYYLFSLINYKS